MRASARALATSDATSAASTPGLMSGQELVALRTSSMMLLASCTAWGRALWRDGASLVHWGTRRWCATNLVQHVVSPIKGDIERRRFGYVDANDCCACPSVVLFRHAAHVLLPSDVPYL